MIDDTELESAKSSHVYSVARNMNTNLETARMGYITEFIKGLAKDNPLTLLKTVLEVDCSLANMADCVCRKLQWMIARESSTLI